MLKIIYTLTIVLLTVKLSLCSLSCDDATNNDLILKSLNGKVKGKCEDVYIYYADKTKNTQVALMKWFGIPFAEPPIEKLRFNKPIPVKSWTNIRDGNNFPNQCVQKLNKNPISEDCLYLNIYSPYESYLKSVVKNNKFSLLPIFVWVHGGSFIEGSGPDYDPSMISAMSNIVSVTINYRLGGLSFLYLSGTNATGNLLLHDQQLAFKWIYDNAERFGGDKNRITICGESAGSTSVGYHLLFKSSWPYFRNAILQSGNPFTDFNDHLLPKKAEEITRKLASKLNCNKKTNQETLSCLQSLDAFYFNDLSLKAMGGFPIIVFDKDLFVEQPMDLYQNGDYKSSANILTGYTSFEQLSLASNEISSFEIKSLQNGDYEKFKTITQNRLNVDDDQFVKVLEFYLESSKVDNKNEDYFYHYVVIVSDYDYKCPTHLFGENLSKHNPNMFLYLYDHKSSTSDYSSKFNGAAHAEEIEFMFGAPLFTNSYGSNEKIFSEQMIKYWTNFVIYDKPSLNDEWPSYIDTDSSTERNLFYLNMNKIKNTVFKTTDAICKFWSDLGVYSKS